jgi:hypothetical protein
MIGKKMVEKIYSQKKKQISMAIVAKYIKSMVILN